MHRRSPLASAYLEYTLSRDLNAAASHWNRMTGVWLYDFDSPGYAPWIRESTGHLCIDVGATSTSAPAHAAALDDPVADVVCLTSGSKNIEQALLSEMELDDIHTILCYGKIRESEISIWAGDVEFGSMWDTNPESDFAPCFAEEKRFFSGALTLADVQKDTPWMYEDTSTGRRYDCPPTDVVDGGWTRIDIQALDGGKFRGPARGVHHFVRAVQLGRAHDVQKWWLSQANHVLRDDKYPGFYEKCFLVTHLSFTISIWNPQDSHTLRGTFMVDAPITPVYLFLFPPQLRLKDGELSARIPYPGEAFYWSHDPRGRDRLSEAAVHALGLPSVFLQARVGGPAWTQANYALLAEFHCAKGFDPTSMDVARDLGYPRANTSEKRRLIFRGIGNSVLRRARETLATYPSCGYEDVCIRCKRIDSLLCLIQDQTVWRRPVQLSLTLPPRSQMQCARSITERMRQASALGGQETEAQMAWRTARPTMSNTYRSISETMRRASDLGS
ncbi:hypothetical protein DFH09DRAFT_463023 [Mycena vulgaris]|nr:hypothetical protein DFH09DRAFT_463023 [Mycena vulgaris]